MQSRHEVFFDAIEKEDGPLISQLLKNKEETIYAKNNEGLDCLELAIELGKWSVLRFLARQIELMPQFNITNFSYKDGNNPLHRAIANKNIKLACSIAGYAGFLLYHKNSLGQYPINIAAEDQEWEIVFQMTNFTYEKNNSMKESYARILSNALNSRKVDPLAYYSVQCISNLIFKLGDSVSDIITPSRLSDFISLGDWELVYKLISQLGLSDSDLREQAFLEAVKSRKMDNSKKDQSSLQWINYCASRCKGAAKDSDNNTVLDLVISRKDWEVIDILLDHNGWDSKTNQQGVSLVEIKIEAKHWEKVIKMTDPYNWHAYVNLKEVSPKLLLSIMMKLMAQEDEKLPEMEAKQMTQIFINLLGMIDVKTPLPVVDLALQKKDEKLLSTIWRHGSQLFNHCPRAKNLAEQNRNLWKSAFPLLLILGNCDKNSPFSWLSFDLIGLILKQAADGYILPINGLKCNSIEGAAETIESQYWRFFKEVKQKAISLPSNNDASMTLN